MADVVLFDKYLYTVKPAWQGARPEQAMLRKGDEVTSSTFTDSVLGATRELERGRSLGAIGSVDTLQLQEAGRAAVVPGATAYNDEELQKKNVEELAAIVGQHPEELDRILALEARKGAKARKGVLALSPDYRELTPDEEAEAAEAAAAANAGR